MAYAIKGFNRSSLNPAAKVFQPRGAGNMLWQDSKQELSDDDNDGNETPNETVQQQELQMQQPPQVMWIPTSQATASLNGQVLQAYPLPTYLHSNPSNATFLDGFYQQQLPPQICANYQPLSNFYQQLPPPSPPQLPQQATSMPQMCQTLPQEATPMPLVTFQQLTNVYEQPVNLPQMPQQSTQLPQQPMQLPQQFTQLPLQRVTSIVPQQQSQYLPQQLPTNLPPQSSYVPRQPLSSYAQLPNIYQPPPSLPQMSQPMPQPLASSVPQQMSPLVAYQQLPNVYQALPQQYNNDMQLLRPVGPTVPLGASSIKPYMCNNRPGIRGKQLFCKPKRRCQQQQQQQQLQMLPPQQQHVFQLQQQQTQILQPRCIYQLQPQQDAPLTAAPHSQWHQIIMSSMLNIMLDEGEPISYAFIVGQLSLRLCCPDELMKRLVPNVMYDASNKGYVRRVNGHFVLGMNPLTGEQKTE